jgi:hypothetical protein
MTPDVQEEYERQIDAPAQLEDVGATPDVVAALRRA